MRTCWSEAPIGFIHAWTVLQVLEISRQGLHRLVHSGRLKRYSASPRRNFFREDDVLTLKKEGHRDRRLDHRASYIGDDILRCPVRGCGFKSTDPTDFNFHQSGPRRGKVFCCKPCTKMRCARQLANRLINENGTSRLSRSPLENNSGRAQSNGNAARCSPNFRS
jgi:hypothetical protein